MAAHQDFLIHNPAHNGYKKEPVPCQCHLDKNNTKSRVCRNMYPVLFYVLFHLNLLTK